MVNINVKHSFNCGDLITILPGLRQLYRTTGKKVRIYQRLNFDAHYYEGQINSTLNKDGNSVCINEQLFYMLKPLIESQEYIESFQVWEGEEVQLDYDLTRDKKSIPLPYGLIHTWGEAVFPETSTDLSEFWIKVGNVESKYSDKVIINKTQRYGNPYVSFFFLKQYEKDLIFSGTDIEHKDFCERYKLDIDHVKVKDFYELAQIISCCRFGVFSQSLHWHIADSIKAKRVLEVCSVFPNTWATGKNGYHAYGQQAMEYYVNKLINE